MMTRIGRMRGQEEHYNGLAQRPADVEKTLKIEGPGRAGRQHKSDPPAPLTP